MKYIFLSIILLSVFVTSCNTSNIEAKPDIIKNLLTLKSHTSINKIDLFFDSIGYKWIQDEHLKDSLLVYINKDSSSSNYYRFRSDFGTVSFATHDFDTYASALKASDLRGFKSFSNRIDSNSTNTTLIKDSLYITFIKEKLDEKPIFTIILFDKQ